MILIGKFANLKIVSYICPKLNFPWGAPHKSKPPINDVY